MGHSPDIKMIPLHIKQCQQQQSKDDSPQQQP